MEHGAVALYARFVGNPFVTSRSDREPEVSPVGSSGNIGIDPINNCIPVVYVRPVRRSVIGSIQRITQVKRIIIIVTIPSGRCVSVIKLFPECVLVFTVNSRYHRSLNHSHVRIHTDRSPGYRTLSPQNNGSVSSPWS